MPRLLSALLVASFFLVSPGHAAVPDGTRLSPEYLRSIASWVEHAMHVRIAAMPIAVASGTTLKTAIGLEGVQQAHSMAAYLPGRIIVNNVVWDPHSPAATSYVVHEMVHHAQMLSGKKYPCRNAREREAYMLQNMWLREHGEEPIYRDDWIDEMSRCPAE